MKKESAWLNWSTNDGEWVLRIWDGNEWEFSRSWKTKDNDETGCGWVWDGILVEIAHLQDLGYNVSITC